MPASNSKVDKRTTELTTRKLYLKNFYYAVGFSGTTPKGKIQTTKILDMDVALWRDASGKVRCVTDQCPVTGARLSTGATGTVTGPGGEPVETITAGDRPLTYNASTGELLSGAAAGEDDLLLVSPSGAPVDGKLASFPLRLPRLEVWDCIERGGFVWLFFGDKDMPLRQRPPIPWVTELDKSGWRGVHGEVSIKGNHWTVMENVIDMAHVPYVHKGTVGNHAAFVDIVIKETPTSLNFAFPIENLHPEGEKAAISVDVRATACMPSTSFIRFTFPFNLRLVTINSIVPIDEHTTVIRFCQMRNFAQVPIVDPLIRRGMENILGEDRIILEMLRPHEVAEEVSLAADAPQLAFRRMRERYIGRGDFVGVGPRPLHCVQSASQG